MHGKRNDRLLADLDCNGWPQTPRNQALSALRRVQAVHLCGDQHLAVVVKHGIEGTADGPYAFTSPALDNTIYGRWWHPEDEKPGPNAVPGSPLPWTGDFKDGLGNRISMLAYANPANIADERARGDGYGIVRFDKRKRQITFECWPRFADARSGDRAQYPGWPITVAMRDNDGRKLKPICQSWSFPQAHAPLCKCARNRQARLSLPLRATDATYQPVVFAEGLYSISVGRDRPGAWIKQHVAAGPKANQGQLKVDSL